MRKKTELWDGGHIEIMGEEMSVRNVVFVWLAGCVLQDRGFSAIAALTFVPVEQNYCFATECPSSSIYPTDVSKTQKYALYIQLDPSPKLQTLTSLAPFYNPWFRPSVPLVARIDPRIWIMGFKRGLSEGRVYRCGGRSVSKYKAYLGVFYGFKRIY